MGAFLPFQLRMEADLDSESCVVLGILDKGQSSETQKSLEIIPCIVCIIPVLCERWPERKSLQVIHRTFSVEVRM